MTDQYITVFTTTLIAAGGMVAFMLWMRQQRSSEKRAAYEREQTIMLQKNAQEQAERTALRHSDDLKNMLATFMAQQERSSKTREVQDAAGRNAETSGLNSGGYIIFNLPESKKSMFHDLLKGFEDYARLRG